MAVKKDPIVQKVSKIYMKISNLKSLKPSKDVDMLFTQLVLLCTPPNPIDVTKLHKTIQEMRLKLIRLCGEAEGLMEKHYATILGSLDNPLHNLSIFPYFSNYIKLSHLEYNILSQHYPSGAPNRVAFVGSGPLPLTSICLAMYHMTTPVFDNYDIDAEANIMASRLIASDLDLSKRMFFHTENIMNVTTKLKDYDVVFLAALVGMNKQDKIQVIDHLASNMEPGALLMVRSAHGARGFLYPVVDPCDLRGFDILSVYHPKDEIINSVMIARKLELNDHDNHDYDNKLVVASIALPSKCSSAEEYIFKMNIIEEFGYEMNLLA